MNVNYSVVIPVYNAEKTLEELADRLDKVFRKKNETYEIIFVDDYSQDNSWSLLGKLAQQDEKIKAIKLAGNFGQHNATLCGMSYSQGRFIVTMDDDLQHIPEDIPKLIDKMEVTEAEIVIARLMEKKHAWYRVKASNMMRILNEFLMKKPTGIFLSSFRLIKRKIAEKMIKRNSPQPYIPALMFNITTNVANAEILHKERKFGNSNYTLLKMLQLASRILVNKYSFLARLIGKNRQVYVIEETLNIEGGRIHCRKEC